MQLSNVQVLNYWTLLKAYRNDELRHMTVSKLLRTIAVNRDSCPISSPLYILWTEFQAEIITFERMPPKQQDAQVVHIKVVRFKKAARKQRLQAFIRQQA